MNNKSKFLMCIYLFLGFSCSRKNVGTTSLKEKNMYDNIPVSNLNMGRTINSGFGPDYPLFFSDATCVVLGKKGVMNVLFAQPGFDPINIPDHLRNQFADIEMVNLSTGNDSDTRLTEQPNWLEKISKLIYLQMEDIRISNLSCLKNTGIKRLVLIRSEPINKNAFLEDLSKLTTLKYLVSNNLFTPDNVAYLHVKLPMLKIMTESVYNDKIDKGEISVFE